MDSVHPTRISSLSTMRESDTGNERSAFLSLFEIRRAILLLISVLNVCVNGVLDRMNASVTWERFCLSSPPAMIVVAVTGLESKVQQ